MIHPLPTQYSHLPAWEASRRLTTVYVIPYTNLSCFPASFRWKSVRDTLYPGINVPECFQLRTGGRYLELLWCGAFCKYENRLRRYCGWQSVYSSRTEALLRNESTGDAPTESANWDLSRSLSAQAACLPWRQVGLNATVDDSRQSQRIRIDANYWASYPRRISRNLVRPTARTPAKKQLSFSHAIPRVAETRVFIKAGSVEP